MATTRTGGAGAKSKVTDNSQSATDQQNPNPDAQQNSSASGADQSTNGANADASGTNAGTPGTETPGAGTTTGVEAEAAKLAEEQRKQQELEHLAEEERKDQEAQALLAAQKDEPQTEVPALFISSRGESFRRCGFRFSKEPIVIALECLTEEQIEILKAEPNLVVEECSALLDDLQVVEAQ